MYSAWDSTLDTRLLFVVQAYIRESECCAWYAKSERNHFLHKNDFNVPPQICFLNIYVSAGLFSACGVEAVSKKPSYEVFDIMSFLEESLSYNQHRNKKEDLKCRLTQQRRKVRSSSDIVKECLWS